MSINFEKTGIMTTCKRLNKKETFHGIKIVKDFLKGNEKYDIRDETFNSLIPSCIDILPEVSAAFNDKLRMAMGTENGGIFLFDPVLKAWGFDNSFMRYNSDSKSKYFKEGKVELVQWLPKTINLVYSSMSMS